MFITHHHEDHTGNIPALQELHQCEAYSPELCCEMKSPPGLSAIQKIIWGNRKAYGDLIPIYYELKTRNHYFQIIPIPGHAPDMAAFYEPRRKWLFSADLYINSHIGFFLESESIQVQI